MSTSTSEVSIGSLVKNGTYARMPIPALKLLADMRKYAAQRILTALCTYMDIDTHECWPGYTSIEKRAGVSRGSIKPSLDLLVELGFLKVTKRYKGGKQLSNFYVVTIIGYKENLWGPELKAYLPYIGICIACGNDVKRSETSESLAGESFHLRCGGSVHKLKKSIPSRPSSQNNKSAIPRGYFHSDLEPGQSLGVEHLKLRKDMSI